MQVHLRASGGCGLQGERSGRLESMLPIAGLLRMELFRRLERGGPEWGHELGEEAQKRLSRGLRFEFVPLPRVLPIRAVAH